MESSPRRFSIPYYASSSISSSVIGSCCDPSTSSGLLGAFNFSLLDSPNVNSSTYETLGQYPATDFSFASYATESELFEMLKETSETGWIGALLFQEFDLSANRYHIGLVRNITQRGAQATIGTLTLIDNVMIQTVTAGGRSLNVRVKVHKILYLFSICSNCVSLGIPNMGTLS